MKDDPNAHVDFLIVVPTALWTSYYDALGRFMHEFAALENGLNTSLLVYLTKRLKVMDTQGNRDVLVAMLGGMRVTALRDTVKRLLRVTDAEDEVVKEIDSLFEQLGEIRYIRDRLAHNGALPDKRDKEGWFYTSNNITIRDPGDADAVYFKPEHLLDMASDLSRLNRRFDAVFTFPGSLEALRAQYAGIKDGDQHFQNYLKELYAPWLYSPSKLKRDESMNVRRRRQRKKT